MRQYLHSGRVHPGGVVELQHVLEGEHGRARDGRDGRPDEGVRDVLVALQPEVLQDLP